MTGSTDLERLRRDYPEWKPWLGVIEEVVAEAASSRWEACVPAPGDDRDRSAPLVSAAAPAFEAATLRDWMARLFAIAAASGSAELETLAGVDPAAADPFGILDAALRQDRSSIERLAAESGAATGAFAAVADLLPIPFLQACGRRWSGLSPQDWTRGYCPICGAWPALAEIRGVERSRRFRCRRCGGDWTGAWLRCPFCGLNDHELLISLVPEGREPSARVDACKRCCGYVKSVTALRASPPEQVIVSDLATVHLDISAVAEGYRRPSGLGYPVAGRIAEKPFAARRPFRWRR